MISVVVKACVFLAEMGMILTRALRNQVSALCDFSSCLLRNHICTYVDFFCNEIHGQRLSYSFKAERHI